MERTFANRVLMVRPASFGANAETAASNVFQSTDASPDALFAARGESVELERGLRDAGVDVLVFDEERDAREGAVSPDACFPNNWFTTHASGRLVLYPMESPSRRREIRSELVDLVMDAVDVREVLDLRHWAERGRFLEGTGSLVLDREAKVAFAALSSRTCEGPLAEWCDAMGYRAVTFRSRLRGKPIYHTNVMLALGPDVALVGLDSVESEDERAKLAAELEATGRELLPLSESDLLAFCGNALHLAGAGRRGVWALSACARRALGDRAELLERTGRLVAPSVDTIERVGGGGVRCMLAELFARSRSRI